MSLNILSDLDKWREVAYVPSETPGKINLRPEAEGLIVYGALAVGMPDLDESTAEEWLTRLRAWEIIDGPVLRAWNDDHTEIVPMPVTMDMLRPFFGTRTNCFPKQSNATFRKRIADAVMERAARRDK